jgi:hypothetical protein
MVFHRSPPTQLPFDEWKPIHGLRKRAIGQSAVLRQPVIREGNLLRKSRGAKNLRNQGIRIQNYRSAQASADRMSVMRPPEMRERSGRD